MISGVINLCWFVAVATVVGTVVAFMLVPMRSLGPDNWKIAAALMGSYIGGCKFVWSFLIASVKKVLALTFSHFEKKKRKFLNWLVKCFSQLGNDFFYKE